MGSEPFAVDIVETDISSGALARLVFHHGSFGKVDFRCLSPDPGGDYLLNVLWVKQRPGQQGIEDIEYHEADVRCGKALEHAIRSTIEELIDSPTRPTGLRLIAQNGERPARVEGDHAQQPFQGVCERAVDLPRLGREILKGKAGIEQRPQGVRSGPEH